MAMAYTNQWRLRVEMISENLHRQSNHLNEPNLNHHQPVDTKQKTALSWLAFLMPSEMLKL